MDNRLKEIRERLENYSCEDSEFIINSKDDIQFLMNALEQAKDRINVMEERLQIDSVGNDKIDEIEVKLNHSQDRQRVLREALNNLVRNKVCERKITEQMERFKKGFSFSKEVFDNAYSDKDCRCAKCIAIEILGREDMKC